MVMTVVTLIVPMAVIALVAAVVAVPMVVVALVAAVVVRCPWPP